MNATANQQYVLVNNVRGANVSEGNYTLRWANAIPSEDAAYRLVFLNYATGGYVTQSDTFNLTLPPGETRNTSTGNAPASPGTNSNTSAKASSGLSSGALAAAIVVPILAIIAILIAALFFWRRKRRQQKQLVEEAQLGKAELAADGKPIAIVKHRSAELNDEKSKHHSAELAGNKDLIQWELPSTPPQKPASPVEMLAEVPIAEMGTDHHKTTLAPSENATTVAGSDSGRAIEEKVSPMIDQNEFMRHSLPSATSPITPRVSGLQEEGGAASTAGRSRFQEALYDIISDELRRPDAPDPKSPTT